MEVSDSHGSLSDWSHVLCLVPLFYSWGFLKEPWRQSVTSRAPKERDFFKYKSASALSLVSRWTLSSFTKTLRRTLVSRLPRQHWRDHQAKDSILCPECTATNSAEITQDGEHDQNIWYINTKKVSLKDGLFKPVFMWAVSLIITVN